MTSPATIPPKMTRVVRIGPIRHLRPDYRRPGRQGRRGVLRFRSLSLKALLRNLLVIVGVAAAGAVAPMSASRQAAAVAPRPAAIAQAAPLATKVLPNGLEIIVFEDHSIPLVTVELAVRNGSFTEPPELNGLSHLYEHMFFKANQASAQRRRLPEDHRPARHRLQRDDQEEVVEYYFTTTTPNFPVAMRFMRDAVRVSGVRRTGVRPGARGRDRRNRPARVESVTACSRLEMNARLFYKYPSRKNPVGSSADACDAATTDMMRLIQSRYYVPNNSAIVITGDVSPQAAFLTVRTSCSATGRAGARDPFVEFPLVEHPPLPKSEAAILPAAGAERDHRDRLAGAVDRARTTRRTYAADVFSFILRQPNSRFQRRWSTRGS